MAVGRARIQRVEFAVHDAIERHRAGSRANHRGENQSENFPARPAAIIARRHHHRCQRERQRENRVRKRTNEAPFFNYGKHLLTQRHRDTEAQRRKKFSCASASLRLCVEFSFFFLRPARHEFLWQAQMIQHARDHGVHHFLNGFRVRSKNLDLPAESSRRPAAAVPCF